MDWDTKVKALSHYLGRPLPEAQQLALSVDEMRGLLSTEDLDLENALFDYANGVTESVFGPRVSFRGIIEFSNVCVKDCGYCGIRKHRQIPRYTMKDEEIVDVALWAFDHGYGSLMLQSGELPTCGRQAWMVHLIREIKRKTKEKEIAEKGVPPGEARGMGVAIGLGELSRQQYQELFDAGAHRYLLRIETSNPELYKRLHPPSHVWENRRQCLRELKEIGYQVGTGVMLALPGQTFHDLASDLMFFREIEADMIGCGPYILQEDTPVGRRWEEVHGEGYSELDYNEELLEVCCRFLSLARITLGDVNISATTALQAIHPIGREIALGRGANQLMPILTTTSYRQNYQLYQGKPCIDEGHEDCRSCLTKRVEFAGKSLHLNDWADPPSYFRKLNPKMLQRVNK